MLEIIRGQTTAQAAADDLIDTIADAPIEGTLYIGYPILSSADETIAVDALLVARTVGLVAFQFDDRPAMPHGEAEWIELQDRQNALAFSLGASLGRHAELRRGRQLAVEPQIITLLPENLEAPAGVQVITCSFESLRERLDALAHEPLDDVTWHALNAALQRVANIKPRKKRQGVRRVGSKGSIIKKLEAKIANLDRYQKPAAIESPDGPQRIRGLAGSGKTVVLALKAAYLHSQHPEWNIAVTFYSRALGQQFRDLIRRFCFEHLGDEPDWERLHVLHAWGGRGRPGFYTKVADHAGAPVRDFAYAKSVYGMSDAFRGVCKELEAFAEANNPEPLFDVVLIDEAQDLPIPFFRLVYHFVKEPRRIIWAYDELQNLSEATMPSTDEMFGTDKNGGSRVRIENIEGTPRRDIPLPRCYRNTPWALAVAHALGFGVYRREGLVQHFAEPQAWLDIGYRVVDGRLESGEQVALERRPDSYPDYMTALLDPTSVETFGFADHHAQNEWVARQIELNLRDDELEADDLLVVFCDPITAKKRAGALMQALARKGIDSHLVGETSSADDVFFPASVAMLHIYRAKGNEAPMVYVLDAQRCAAGPELARLRNTLFTAITRSRAWVRICGYGEAMSLLIGEIEAVRRNEFRLSFEVPTGPQLDRMRRVHRDLAPEERRAAERAHKGLQEFIKAFRMGAIDAGSLGVEEQDALRRILRGEEAADDNGE